MGAEIWNNQPKVLRKIERKHFTKHLNDWLQKTLLYTLVEFVNWRTAGIIVTIINLTPFHVISEHLYSF